MKGIRSIKGRFRYINGFDQEHHCRGCGKLVKVQAGNRTVYKCREIGLNGCVATDVHLKEQACRLYVPREGD